VLPSVTFADLTPVVEELHNVALDVEEIDFTSDEGGWGIGANRMVVELSPTGQESARARSSTTCRAGEDG
jgi:hypothetical protein